MADDPQFKIGITVDADEAVRGAQQTAAALKSVGGEGAKAADEGAEKTSRWALKKADLKKAVQELGREFPLAGAAARAFMNPLVFSITAVIGLFVRAKDALAEWNAKMDAVGSRNASRDFLPGIEAKARAMQEAKTAAAEFAAALEQVGRASDWVNESIQRGIEKFHEHIAAQAEVNSAGEARDLAQVNLQEKLGKMTGGQAIEARAAIRERYRKAGDDLKTKGEQGEVTAMADELALQQAGLPAAKDAEKAARERRDKAKARIAQLTADAEAGKSKEGEYRQEYEDALAKKGAIENLGPGYGRFKYTPEQRKRLAADAEAEADEAYARWTRQRRLNLDASGQARALASGELPAAEAGLDTASSALRARVDRIGELNKNLPGKREVYGIREVGRTAAGALASETGHLEAAGQIAGQLTEATNKQAQLEREISRSIMAGKGASEDMISALREQTANIEEMRRQLRAEMAELRGAVANGRTR